METIYTENALEIHASLSEIFHNYGNNIIDVMADITPSEGLDFYHFTHAIHDIWSGNELVIQHFFKSGDSLLFMDESTEREIWDNEYGRKLPIRAIIKVGDGEIVIEDENFQW